MSNTKTKDPTWAKFIAYTLALAILLGIIWVFWKIISFISWSITRIQHLTTEDWALLGEIARNTSGWIALIAAIGTITAMLITNRSRAREAASADFRDHIQWAVEKVSSNNQFEVAFAQSVIWHFSQNKPKNLSREEHQLVLELQETLQNMLELAEFPQPESLTQEKNDASKGS